MLKFDAEVPTMRPSPPLHRRRVIGSGKRTPTTLSSNALASQLYRSSSFNSSGRSSNCDTGEDLYSDADASLEDDVLDLNHKVQMLQQQVGVLADNQNNADERYTRAKQDNAALQARVLMLEEQLRETELRSDERVQDEQRRHKELMVRFEREKQLEIENYAIRLQTAESESGKLREEASRLRMQSDQLRAEKVRLQEELADSEAAVAAVREEMDEHREQMRRREAAHQQRERLVDELSAEVDRLRQAALEGSAIDRDAERAAQAQVRALEAQLEQVRQEARTLREANEELQALVITRGVEEGRSLLTGGPLSLAHELEAMSQDEHNSETKIRQTLKEQQEVNAQLRSYIDGILLNIVENYPQLLEVKRNA